MPTQAKEQAIERLPKWAQQEISRLEANVAHWRAKALGAPGHEHRTVQVAPSEERVGYEDELPLASSQVRFKLDDDVDVADSDYVETHITHHFGRRMLEVRASGRRGSAIIVHPGGSNTVYVELEHRT